MAAIYHQIVKQYPEMRNHYGQEITDESYRRITRDAGESSLRYRFTHVQKFTNREKLLIWYFEQAFNKDPHAMVTAACTDGAAVNSTWKYRGWVLLPRAFASTINHPYVKIALTIVGLIYGYRACVWGYTVSQHFLVARAIPLMINNTPVSVIRSMNHILNLKDVVLNYRWTILFYTWMGQQVLRLMPIPYVSNLAERVSIISLFGLLFRAPSTIYSFAVDKAISAATFTWTTCGSIGDFIESRAQKNEDEILAIYKHKMLAAWKTHISVAH